MINLAQSVKPFCLPLLVFGLLGCSQGGKENEKLLPVSLWEDVTAETIGHASFWTNRVELADINGDNRVDIICAVGGTNTAPAEPALSRVYLNQGPGKMFKDISEEVFGKNRWISRVIKVHDVNDDGAPDILVGTNFSTQSRLFLGDGNGGFRDVTSTHLPQIAASIGDFEFGDADGDGDLDVVLTDWGPGNPNENDGGRPMLWINDGSGRFSDATSERMPDVRAKFSWEIEFADVDNDYDLDVLVTARFNTSSFLFENDGSGYFTDRSETKLPQYENNYDFEAMDLDGDGYLDLLTINDGEAFEGFGSPHRQHIFLNDRKGGFTDVSATHWPESENPAYDDNVSVYLDVDSDGDADALIASLTGPDRVLVNDGKGHLRQAPDVFTGGGPTAGTLHIAVADLNGDKKLDVVQAQGETVSKIEEGALEDRVYFGRNIAPDTAPPVIAMVENPPRPPQGEPLLIRARIHDNKSPLMPRDWRSVVLSWSSSGTTHEKPMTWYGEYLWRGAIDDVPSGVFTYRICATDAAGNITCSPEISVEPE